MTSLLKKGHVTKLKYTVNEHSPENKPQGTYARIAYSTCITEKRPQIDLSTLRYLSEVYTINSQLCYSNDKSSSRRLRKRWRTRGGGRSDFCVVFTSPCALGLKQLLID